MKEESTRDKKWFSRNDKYSRWRKIINPWKFPKSWAEQIIAQADDQFSKQEIERIINTPIKSNYSQKRPLKLNGLNIWLNPFSPFNSLGTYYGAFILKEHAKISGFPDKKDRFIMDIGANEGFYSLFIKKYFPATQIIAVEPDPVASKVLKRNIDANKFKKVKIINCAVTNKNGEINFQIIPTDTVINSIKIERKSWMKKGIIMNIKIKSATLPKIFNDYNIQKVDLMKIDTEGSEVKILEGAGIVLDKIEKIVVEHHNKSLHKKVKEILKKKFNLIYDEGAKYGNSYFVKK